MTQNEIPQIEGHAAFYTHLKSGRIDQAKIIGLDGERFVEKILFGRKYWEAPIITSRICGICPVIHNITASKAMESALGVKISRQTTELRELMLCGQMVQSHSLHLYLLVLPQLMGINSSFELQANHPDLFNNAILLKNYADTIIETIAGRAVHPISNTVGGFKAYPTKKRLEQLIKQGETTLSVAENTLRLFATYKFPLITSKMIFSAMKNHGHYAVYEGEIESSNGKVFDADEYKKYIIEELMPYNKAKYATLRGEIFMVGAMARYNTNQEHLSQGTKQLVTELNIPNNFENPFYNILAQAIENYHFVERSIELSKQLYETISAEDIIQPKFYKDGAGACEAPRGTLFHYYKVDKNGYIEKADIITPTVQNLSAMENDMKLLNPKDYSEDELNMFIELLIKSYDPCITCATH